jgi:hypothetical protein
LSFQTTPASILKIKQKLLPASICYERTATFRTHTISHVPCAPTVFHLNQALAGDEKPAFVVRIAAYLGVCGALVAFVMKYPIAAVP